ncbi:hypothetical protein VKT23_002500 [Stygiomarasmius scandens]|uniref:Uncharacterized protein n=1 Tax=Marasmiellus scandens TaxID=2682957 RepID=A0ABR1K4T2_9AGAR
MDFLDFRDIIKLRQVNNHCDKAVRNYIYANFTYKRLFGTYFHTREIEALHLLHSVSGFCACSPNFYQWLAREEASSNHPLQIFIKATDAASLLSFLRSGSWSCIAASWTRFTGSYQELIRPRDLKNASSADILRTSYSAGTVECTFHYKRDSCNLYVYVCSSEPIKAVLSQVSVIRKKQNIIFNDLDHDSTWVGGAFKLYPDTSWDTRASLSTSDLFVHELSPFTRHVGDDLCCTIPFHRTPIHSPLANTDPVRCNRFNVTVSDELGDPGPRIRFYTLSTKNGKAYTAAYYQVGDEDWNRKTFFLKTIRDTVVWATYFSRPRERAVSARLQNLLLQYKWPVVIRQRPSLIMIATILRYLLAVDSCLLRGVNPGVSISFHQRNFVLFATLKINMPVPGRGSAVPRPVMGVWEQELQNVNVDVIFAYSKSLRVL